MYRRSLLSFLIVAALVFAVAACDFSPTASFSGFGGEQGATLNGQFRQRGGTAQAQLTADSTYGAYAALAASSLAAPDTVVVLENASDLTENAIASVDIEDDGSFTLRGLPESFFLRFLDAGVAVGDDIPFNGVKPNQEIDIVVALRNGEVVLLEERRTGIDHQNPAGIELGGIATVLTMEDDLITGTLDVNGESVCTQEGETSIRKGNRSLTLEDIDGKKVHVRGIIDEPDCDGGVFAHEIKLQEEEEVDLDGEQRVTICHVPPGNPDNAKTKTVGASAVPAHLAHGDYLGACQ